MQRVKMGKKKSEEADLKWKHSTEAVEKGKITYICKFLGCTPVNGSKGSELIKESIKKLQFANDIKKSEEGLKASKLKKVEFCVSVQNLVLTDLKSKTTLYSFPLQRISYCADDKSSKKLFGFIAREKEKPQHHCYVLESEKNAEELTLAVGQAFDLAYKKFKASQAVGGKKEVDDMKHRVESTEKENEILRKKLEELERGQQEATPAQDRVTAAPTTIQGTVEPAVNEFQPQSTGQGSFDPFSDGNFAENSVTAGPTGSNPFAIHQQEDHAKHEDLFNMFSATDDQPAPPASDDPFDPLSNGLTRNPPEPSQNMPPFNQVPTPQVQNEMPTSVSRPKPATLSPGLLPPPPTKQSMKAAQKQRNSNTPDNPADPFAAFSSQPDSAGLSNSHQGMQDVQDGMQNNLVLF